MAFPQVIATNSSQTTTVATSHTVALPATIASGELLVVAFSYGASSSITFPAGWTRGASSEVNGAGGTYAYRVATGAEGASVTVTTGTAVKSAHRSWRIRGHNTSTNAITDVGFWASATSATPDAGASTPVGGAKDYLWLWMNAGGLGRICTAAPASYLSLEISDAGSGSGASALSTARREVNAASENPGTAVMESSGAWVSLVIAIHPGTEGNTAPPPAGTTARIYWANLEVPVVPPTAGKRIGCTYTNLGEFETVIGRPVDLVQIYAGTDTPPTGDWATITSLANLGYGISVTYNSSFTLAQITSGSEDARTIAIAQFLEALPTVGIVGFMHESETAGYVASEFKAAASRIYGLLNTHAPSWQTIYTFLGGFADSGTTNHQFGSPPRVPGDWWPTPNQPDLVGFDYYNWRGTSVSGGVFFADPTKADRPVTDIAQSSTGGVNQGIDSFMEFAASLTPVPKIAFPEFGCSVEDAAGGPDQRAAWIQSFADAYGGDPRVEFVNYFDHDSSETPQRVNWRISGGLLPSEAASGVAFASISASGTTITMSGTNTATTPVTVPAGDTLRFDPNTTTTLIMDNVNLVVYGTLEMHPANAGVIHTLRFINVNESAFVGGVQGGMSMVPVVTDIGLWVMDEGILDAIGTAKVGWDRTGNSSTWADTDEMLRSPWGINYLTYPVHVKGTAPETILDPQGNVHTNEVFNLTRNVRFEGTPGHKTHVLIMTPGIGQTIKYCSFQHMGPRKLVSGVSQEILGRWSGVHLHHVMDGGYDSLIEGVVAKDGGSHAFVAHDTNGVTFRDCVAYNMNEDAYWWDVTGEAKSTDVLYDHCLAAKMVPANNEMFQLAGFNLGAGKFNPAHGSQAEPAGSCIDCVAVGNQGPKTSPGFVWGENNHGIWTFQDCVAHNNRQLGIYVWHNANEDDLFESFTAFRNFFNSGVVDGAYGNNYRWTGLNLFANGVNAYAGGIGPDMQWNVTSGASTGGRRATMHDSWVETMQTGWHVTNPDGTSSVLIKDCHIGNLIIHENRRLQEGGANFARGLFDFVRCESDSGSELEPADIEVLSMYVGGMSTNDSNSSVYRFQRKDMSAYQVVVTDPSNILHPPYSIVNISPFFFAVSTFSLSQATQNMAYSQPITLFGGTAPFTWTLASGSLPAGLTLNQSGVISGTPTQSGTFPITVKATDSRPYPIFADMAYSLIVNAATAPLQVTTTSLPGGFVATSYSQTLAATGGTGVGKVWTLASGTLPPGIGLSATGIISGTPTTTGLANFTVRVTDNGANTATQALSINVVTLNPVIVTASPLPAGVAGVAYPGATVAATGGTPPYTWSIPSGSLPAGLSLAASTGVISGTPTTAGTSSPTIRATDAAARTNDKLFSFTIAPPLSFLAGTPPGGRRGIPYSFTFTAQGGAAPYTFDVGQANTLPPGLTLASSGILSGTPAQAGTFTFDAIVQDSLNVIVFTSVTIVISGTPKIAMRALSMRGSSRYVTVS